MSYLTASFLAALLCGATAEVFAGKQKQPGSCTVTINFKEQTFPCTESIPNDNPTYCNYSNAIGGKVVCAKARDSTPAKEKTPERQASPADNTKCPICGKTMTRHYDLPRHMETHNENKQTFPCSQCEKVFSRKDALQRHMKSHSPSRRSMESIRTSYLQRRSLEDWDEYLWLD